MFRIKGRRIEDWGSRAVQHQRGLWSCSYILFWENTLIVNGASALCCLFPAERGGVL